MGLAPGLPRRFASRLHAAARRALDSGWIAARLTRSLALIPLFGLLLLAALWTAFAVRYQNEREAVLAAELRQVDSLAAAFSEHTLRKLRDLDRTSWMIKAQFERDGIVNLPYLARNRLVPTDGSVRIHVTDSAGNVVASTREFTSTVNLADRELFRHHVPLDTGTLFVSGPFRGHDHDATSFRVSRRLNLGDGSFGGVVILSTEPSHFADFYRESQLGSDGMLALLGVDGIYRMRRTGNRIAADVEGNATPLYSGAMAQDEGTFIRESAIDGTRRLLAYRKLADYPLIVAVARAEFEVLAQFDNYWARYRNASIGASIVIVLFFAFNTVLAYRARRAAVAVRRREGFLQAMVDNAPLGVVVTAMKEPDRGRILAWNPGAEAIFGVAAADALGRMADSILPAAAAASLAGGERPGLAPSLPHDAVKLRVDLPHGGRHVLRIVHSPILDADDRVEHVLAIVHDITSDEAHADALRLSAKVFDSTADAIVISDADDVVVAVNPAFAQLTGFEPASMLGKPFPESPFRSFAPGEHATLQETLARDGCVTTEVLRHRKDGTPLPCWLTKTLVRGSDGEIVNHVRVFTDISALKEAYRKLEKAAHFDTLTGLGNRRMFHDRFAQALARASRSGRHVALLFVDLDGFKEINDVHGHDAGDAALREISLRLQECVRATDSLCRLGGDEFTIVMEDVTLPEDAALVADRIERALDRPIEVGGALVHCRASVGIAAYPDHGRDAGTLLTHADREMYRAKDVRKRRVAANDAQSERVRAAR